MATPTQLQPPPPPGQTTVTVTSFYLSPTASSSSESSGGGGGGTSKRFAALASGAAVGGFLLTCIIGWFLFQVWKKRHPHKWNGRTDAENFPGWRRVTAQRLFEAQAADVLNDDSTRDVTEKNSENGYSKSEDLSQSGLGCSVMPSSPPRLPLPVMSASPPSSPVNEKLMYRRASSLVSHASSNTPNLMQEYAAALAFESAMHRAESRLSHQSRRSLSPSSDITPDVRTFDELGHPSINNAGAGDVLVGSESSHSHSHYSHYSYQYQRSASASGTAGTYGLTQQQQKPRSRAPSLKTRRSNSQHSVLQLQPGRSSSAGGVTGSGVAGPTSSSWHGHTMLTMPRSHVTWAGFPSDVSASSQQYLQNQNQPPTAWNAGGHAQRRSSSSSVQQLMQMHSPQQQQSYFHADVTVTTPEAEYGRLQQPRQASTQSTSPLFFIPQNADSASAPPSPPEPPKRRLTCTNPDETKSLAPSKPSRSSTPEPDR